MATATIRKTGVIIRVSNFYVTSKRERKENTGSVNITNRTILRKGNK